MRTQTIFCILLVLGSTFCRINPLQSRSTANTDSLQTDTVRIVRGRMLNILLGIRKPGMDEAWRRYVNIVFPLAMKYRYDSGAAFNVVEPTRGNYHPGFVTISSWPDKSFHARFRSDPDLPPDLARQRRNIWSRFDQLYFDKLEAPIEFVARSDRVYVFTAYWIADSRVFKKYLDSSMAEMRGQGGRLLARLGSGTSPKNHLYDPDTFLVSEWPSAASYKQFLRKLEAASPEDGLRNTNEFITTYVFNY